MLRFVGTDSNGLPLKRGQLQHACEPCRKRKKRCTHTTPYSTRRTADALIQITSNPSHSPVLTPRLSATKSTNAAVADPTSFSKGNERSSSATDLRTRGHTAVHEEEDESRFVGDLNPEGVFLSSTSPGTSATSIDDKVGVWISRRTLDQVHNRITATSPSTTGEALTSRSKSALLRLAASPTYQQLHALPSPANCNKLRQIYREEFHPVFPVIDLERLDQMSTESSLRHVMLQSICLAASTSPRARPYMCLSLPDLDSTPLSPRVFAEKMVIGAQIPIDGGLIRDKLVIIQVLTIISLCTQFTDDRHSSAEIAARAISYVQTIGLHLDTSVTRQDHKYVSRLFCCTWALDRLSAAFHGRPVLIHERDVGRDLSKDIEQQESGFQLLLRTISLLDSVIGLYRPDQTNDGLEIQNFPAFEDLLQQRGTLRIPSYLVATIETLYHATAMLSYRSQTLNELTRSSPSHLRQSLSAASIATIVGSEFKNQLSLFPFVPYAVSLSLRVAYRELRLSKSSFMRSRARRQLLTTCEILRSLSDVFSTPMLMVELAEQTVKEMDKIASSMSATQREATHDEAAGPSEPDHPIPAEAVIPPTGLQSTLQTHQQMNQDIPLRPEDQEPPEIRMLEFTTFEDVPDFDIFDHFDPDFDLSGVDAALANSIDPSFPTSLIDFSVLSNFE